MIALALLCQIATVGDTLWVRRTVAVPAGREVRPPEWRPAGDVEVLGRPRVVRRGDSVEIAWPVTLWAPGQHTVQVPGPALLAADGHVDSLPPATFTLVAASVLPATPPDTGLRPQPSVPTVPLQERSLVPLLLLIGLTGLVLLPAHLLWRRRGKPISVPNAGPSPTSEPPVERWTEWGETRAVIGAAVERLREGVARRVPEAHPALDVDSLIASLMERRPAWPLAEVAELLRTLERARFAPGHAFAEPEDGATLYRRAVALESQLPA